MLLFPPLVEKVFCVLCKGSKYLHIGVCSIIVHYNVLTPRKVEGLRGVNIEINYTGAYNHIITYRTLEC